MTDLPDFTQIAYAAAFADRSSATSDDSWQNQVKVGGREAGPG